MNLKQMFYFSEIAKSRSFSLAAQNLFVSQPLLSQTVKQLEEELGVTLIYRTNHEFFLTSSGEAFLDSCNSILNSFYDIPNRVKSSNDVCGKVTICMPATLLNIYFPDFLAEFADKYPHIEIEVLEEGSYRVRDMICNHEADLGIVMLPVNSEGMNIYPLVEDECCLVTNDQHRLAKNAVTNLLELENEKLIIYNKNFVLYKEIKEAFGNMGIVPHIVNTSSMPSFIIKMVMLGQGISILPRPVLDTTHAAFTTSRLDPKIPWRIALLEYKKHYMPIAASCLKDAILNHQFNIKKIEYCIPSPECIEKCTQFNS